MKRFLAVRKLSGALFVAATVTIAVATGCSEKPSQSSLPTPNPHGSNTVSNATSKSILASNKQPFKETDELKARGLCELNSARAADAVKTFNRVLALSPRDALSRSMRGRAWARIGKFKQAFADFDNAIKHDTTCADAYLSRALTSAALGLTDLSLEDAKKALANTDAFSNRLDRHERLRRAELHSLLRNDKLATSEAKGLVATYKEKHDVETLLLLANANILLGDMKESIRLVNNAIASEPRCPDLYLLRSYLYLSLNEFNKAISDADVYLKSQPAHPYALYLRATSNLYLASEKATVLNDLNGAIQQMPTFALAIKQRAAAYHHYNEYQNAVRDWTRYLELNPSDQAALAERAHSYGHLEKWTEALKDTTASIALKPTMRAYEVRAWTHNDSGQFKSALDDFAMAIKLEPKVARNYFSRGMCNRENKRYKDAIADFTRSIELDSKNAIAYCARGSAFLSDQQYEQAIRDCTKSLQLDSSRTHPLLTRGIAHARTRKFELTISDFSEAIAKAPKYGEAYYERSLAYKSMGKLKEALDDITNANKYGHGSPDAM